MSVNPQPGQPGNQPVFPALSSEKPKTGKSGISLVFRLLVALAYIAIIPFATFASLSALTTYFPDQTRAVLGPIFSKVMGETQKPQGDAMVEALLEEKTAALSDRVRKIETSVEKMLEKVQNAPALGEGASSTAPNDEARKEELLNIVNLMEEKTRTLGSLSAITVARIEYSMGNMQKCENELNSAKALLDKAKTIPDEIKDMLRKAIQEVNRGSIQAEDWLSLSWHSLYEELEKTSPTLK